MTQSVPPTPVISPLMRLIDRRNARVRYREHVPGILDQLRARTSVYTGNTVQGMQIRVLNERVTYTVDGEPPLGTPGTWENYTLTPVDRPDIVGDGEWIEVDYDPVTKQYTISLSTLNRAMPQTVRGTTLGVVTVDFLALRGRPVRRGTVGNLGEEEFDVMLTQGGVEEGPATIIPTTSLELTSPTDQVRILAVGGLPARYQVMHK